MDPLPKAQVVHQSPNRLRLRIPSQKRDSDFFAQVVQNFSKDFALERLEVNALTGSILFIDERIDQNSISGYAESNNLFSLQSGPLSLPHKVAGPFGNVSHYLHRLTSGELDLPGIAFLALLSIGIYQLFRGKSKVPPWYTAFWYAFGVFSRALKTNHNN